MQLSTLFEIYTMSEHEQRRLCLKIQTGLLERLPDDFDATLTGLFSSTSLYHYGKVAVRIRHPSFTSLVNGELYVFPRTESSYSLVYAYKGQLERQVIYSNFDELAKDVDGNIQTNSI